MYLLGIVLRQTTEIICYTVSNLLMHIYILCGSQIGDFGMARDIAGSGGGSDYYKSHGGIIPVKWTAPEVRGHYTIGRLTVY